MLSNFYFSNTDTVKAILVNVLNNTYADTKYPFTEDDISSFRLIERTTENSTIGITFTKTGRESVFKTKYISGTDYLNINEVPINILTTSNRIADMLDDNFELKEDISEISMLTNIIGLLAKDTLHLLLDVVVEDIRVVISNLSDYFSFELNAENKSVTFKHKSLIFGDLVIYPYAPENKLTLTVLDGFKDEHWDDSTD